MFNPVRWSQIGAVVAACAAVLTLVTPAAAENETVLKSYFEGKHVTLRIDMPGTSGGVDVQADVSRAVDYQRYGDDLKRYGTAIHAGDISLLRKGMLRADAERAFGTAVESSQRREGGLAITTLVFVVGEQRIAADFTEDVLIRYTITSK
jgi:hypothetical protein